MKAREERECVGWEGVSAIQAPTDAEWYLVAAKQ
jgi:hypothetical protein